MTEQATKSRVVFKIAFIQITNKEKNKRLLENLLQIDVCLGDDLQMFYLSEVDGQNVLDDPNLVRLIKSSDVWPRP